MKSRTAALIGAALPLTTLAFVAPSAQAAVPWTVLPTGTTDLITAVDYKGDTVAFGTVTGDVYVGTATGGFAPAINVPGEVVSDISLSPDGTKGVALAGNDAYVYDGASWTAADWTDVTYDLAAPGATYPNGFCPSTPGSPGDFPAASLDLTVDLADVEWLDNQTALISVDDVESSVLKTTDGGATWAESARDSAGSCLLEDIKGPDLTVTGPTVWVMSRTAIMRSLDAFATVQPFGVGADHEKLAVDPSNPLRQLQSKDSAHYTHLALTENAWEDYAWIRSSDDTKKVNDIVSAPGRFYAVGSGGLLERVGGSGLAEQLTVPGHASTEWRAAALNSPTELIVAGAGGTLALTTNPKAPTGGGGGGGDDNALPPTSNPPVAGGTASVKGGKVRFKVRGKLARPDGTSKAQACQGRIKVTVKASPKKKSTPRTVKKTKVKVKKSCKYVKKIAIKRSKIGKAKKLRLILRFTGNDVIGKSTGKYAVRVRR